MKKLLIVIILIIAVLPATANQPFEYRTAKKGFKYIYHPHNESSYQHAYCQAVNGVEEYENIDKTRVDCLTDDYAIEFDFANKCYEAIGQALHYAVMTGKKPKVVLILDKKYKNKQMIYFERVKQIGEIYNIDVEYISDEILNINKKKKCPYKDCKCNKNYKKRWLLSHLFKYNKVYRPLKRLKLIFFQLLKQSFKLFLWQIFCIEFIHSVTIFMVY